MSNFGAVIFLLVPAAVFGFTSVLN